MRIDDKDYLISVGGTWLVFEDSRALELAKEAKAPKAMT